jgi:hypothetical protein
MKIKILWMIYQIRSIFLKEVKRNRGRMKVGCQTSPKLLSILPLFLFTSSKKINSKIFQLFYTFYITSIIFYYYSNKKIHYKTKLFHFSIKYFQILYHINHFLLYNTKIFHNTTTYQTTPKVFKPNNYVFNSKI